jgi:hypothetical protein
MSRVTMFALVSVFLLSPMTVSAQFPQPLPEHRLLQQDVGTWDAKLSIWMDEKGVADPKAKPVVSSGREVNRMLGDFWVISTFNGNYAGMPFEGHSTNGYDPNSKKFVGTWIDSFTPHAMKMEGTYDEKTKTLTSYSTGVGMDGKETKGKSIMKYNDDGTRTFTMFDMIEGEPVKSMEIVYTPVKENASKSNE